MSAADLLLRIGTDNAPFNRGLAQAKAAGEKWGNDLSHELTHTIKSAFGAAAVVEGVREFGAATLEHVKNIKHIAEQYSITTDEAQRVGIATKRLELEDAQFGQVILKTNEARKKANEGNEELRSTFQKYGQSVNDTLNPQLTTIGLLARMFGTVEEGKMSFEDQNELMDIFSLRGVKMVAVIKMLAQVNQERHPLITEEEINTIDKASHAFEEFTRQRKVVGAVSLNNAIKNPWGTVAELAIRGPQAIASRVFSSARKSADRLSNHGNEDSFEMPMGALHSGLIKAGRIVQVDPLERKRNMEEDAQLATAQEKYWTAQEKFRVAQFGPMEKERQLRRKLIELKEEEIAEGRAMFPDRAKILDLKAQQLDAKTEILGLTPRQNDASPLQRVGNFLGAGDDRPLQQFRMTNAHLAQIRASLQHIQQSGGI